MKIIDNPMQEMREDKRFSGLCSKLDEAYKKHNPEPFMFGYNGDLRVKGELLTGDQHNREGNRVIEYRVWGNKGFEELQIYLPFDYKESVKIFSNGIDLDTGREIIEQVTNFLIHPKDFKEEFWL